MMKRIRPARARRLQLTNPVNTVAERGSRGSSEDRRSSYREALEEAGPYLGLGLQIGAMMAFFVGMGYLVDAWLQTDPWFVLVGAVLGMTALIVQLVQISNRLSEDSRKRKKDSRSRESNIDEE